MNLMDLFIKIGVDDQASKKIADITGKVGNGLATAAKVGAAAVGAAAAGVAALTKASIDQFAEYEQLVGGAELMFGNAYETVAKNASEAYKTVQMSQNDYLKQVNGFATGLKTALGGNEQAAADLAHKIIQAEADVIAATGNTQEAVQNAFNGIMKNNFTMLDNLQIGITPTKEGFQEVIDKVNEWNAASGEATSYQMGNLADMQSALVDYIEMVGMSGYASNEAAGTIQGSIASMQGAWSNLVVGIATNNAEIDVLLDNFLLSVQTVAANVGPVIATVIDNILTLLINNGPAMIAQGGEQLNKFLVGLTSKMPEVIKFIGDMVIAMGKALLNSLPYMLDVAISFMASVLTTMTEAAVNIGKNIVSGVWSGIQAMAGWFRDSVMGFFSNIVNGVKSALGIHSPSRVFAEIGKNMALGLGGGWEKEISDIRKDVMNDMDFGEATINGSVQVATGGGYYSQNSTETNTNVIHAILEYLATLEENMGENMRNALDGISLELNEREFIRLVKAVN